MINSAPMNLKERFVSGVSWSAGAQTAQQVLTLGISIILARHLLPKDYGLVAMVLVFTGFADMLIEGGFSAALVQNQRLDPQHTSSAFWINTAAAAALAVAFYFAAPFIAGFYEAPALEPVARWLSPIFVLSAIRIVPSALLLKSMAFDRLAKIDVFTLLIPGVLAICLAINGWGVWSLVIQNLANQAMKSALIWFYSPWRPRLCYSQSAVRELFGYSANLAGYHFIQYWGTQSHALLIGKFMDSSSLGIYTRAQGLVLVPVMAGVGIVGRVMFPILSSIQNDTERVKRTYLRTIRLIAFVTFPMMLGLLVVAESFVLTLLGSSWAAVAPIIQIFCCFGITQTLCYPAGSIFLVKNRTDLLLKWSTVSAGILITSVIIGISFGAIEAVALAFIIANIALTYPYVAISGKLIGVTFAEVIGHVAGVFGCAAAMAIGVWGLGLILPSDWPTWAVLLSQVFAGIVMYGAIAWLVNLDAFVECRDVVLQLKYKRKIASTYG